MLLVVAFGVTSCLSSSNNSSTLYSDAAITSFVVTAANRVMHTTSKSGADSTYKVKLTTTSYKFHIDNVKHEIYNTDSLPVGTDVSKVLCSITVKNNGMLIYWDEKDANAYYVYNTKDSIDFTNPRVFEVYANDGKGSTKYTVKVNVHKEKADSFVWQQMPSSDVLAQLSNVSAYDWMGDIYLTGDIGDKTKFFAVDKNGGLKEIVEGSNKLPEGIKRWIGTTSKEIYALSTDNHLMVSKDDGKTWERDILDEDESLLPVQDIAFVSYPLEYASNTEYALMVGNRSTSSYPQERIAMVWRKIVDNDEYTPEGFWSYLEPVGKLTLPRMEHMSLVAYDDGILCIGGGNLGADIISSPYDLIYQSRDDGITWKLNDSYQMPEGFEGSMTNSVGMAVDNEDNLWLFCGGTGQIWRGRLNKLGWEIQN